MNNYTLKLLILAIGLICSVDVMADRMSKKQYKAQDKKINVEFKKAKADCNSLADNANDICIAEAKATQSIAKAELQAQYKPTVNNRYTARAAKAEADYSVAIQVCDDKAGNDKDVCVKEAEAAKVKALADAEVQIRTSKANSIASEKSVDARQAATAEKLDANYAVAKEKCEVLAGEAKEVCVGKAKLQFGQK